MSQPGGDSVPPEVSQDAEVLVRMGANPDELIATLERANEAIAANEAQALKRGVNQESDAETTGSETPKQVIAENLQMIEFLKSLHH